tara:strand:- start:202 stop:504 length:303 start_codon:yes stop_codon:yes gene_type:complete
MELNALSAASAAETRRLIDRIQEAWNEDDGTCPAVLCATVLVEGDECTYEVLGNEELGFYGRIYFSGGDHEISGVHATFEAADKESLEYIHLADWEIVEP